MHVPTFSIHIARSGAAFDFVDCNHAGASVLLRGTLIRTNNSGVPLLVDFNGSVILQRNESTGVVVALQDGVEAFGPDFVSNVKQSIYRRGWLQFDYDPPGGPKEQLHVGDTATMRIPL